MKRIVVGLMIALLTFGLATAFNNTAWAVSTEASVQATVADQERAVISQWMRNSGWTVLFLGFLLISFFFRGVHRQNGPLETEKAPEIKKPPEPDPKVPDSEYEKTFGRTTPTTG